MKTNTKFWLLVGLMGIFIVNVLAVLLVPAVRSWYFGTTQSFRTSSFAYRSATIEVDHPANWIPLGGSEDMRGDWVRIARIWKALDSYTGVTINVMQVADGSASVIADGDQADIATLCLDYELVSRRLEILSDNTWVIYEYTCVNEYGREVDYKTLYLVKEGLAVALSMFAPQESWQELSPVFDRVLGSVSIQRE